MRKGRKYDPDRFAGLASVMGYRRIAAPKSLSIYEHEGSNCGLVECINFIDALKEELPKSKCMIDFSETKVIKAPALLLIYSVIQQIKERGSHRSLLRWPKSASAKSIIKRSKLSALIKHGKYDYQFESYDDLPVLSGVGSEGVEVVVNHIQRKIYSDKLAPEIEWRYGDAVSETVGNVALHAYPNKNKEQKKWWILCDVIGNDLYLAIYDQGVGIPKTVVDKNWFWASLKHTYPQEYSQIAKDVPDLERAGLTVFIPKRLTDAQLISMSMIGDVTGTKKSKHGQGSKSIKALVNETKNGKLWVYSNKGLYSFIDEDKQTELYKLPAKFPGTLIQWNIKLS